MDRLISEKQCQQLMDLASVSVLSWKSVFFCYFCGICFLCVFSSHVHSHTHTCTHAHMHTYTYTHAHMHTFTYTHAHMHTCTHIHTCTHSHPHTQYGSEGDGYSQKSPHTNREKFEGLNILDAAKVPTLHYTHCKIAVHIALFLLQTIETRERRMRTWQAEYLFEKPFLFSS